MPMDPNDFRTGGALQGAVAASLVRTRDVAAELAPGAQIGIYRVLRELGRGGMAVVYLAERNDGEYEQQVALKWMLQAQPDAASEALFRRERQALANLRHPHIARLLDGGRNDEGRPWFAMELIEGERLDRHCVNMKLPTAQRLALFQQVCAAVAFAHARGVIHHDIKPSNVLVDSDGSAKLLDFGIAQLLGQDDNLTARAYTPGFASPEQIRGETLTVASDVYQLGRLLASLLSRDSAEQDTLTVSTTALPTISDSYELPLPRETPADLVAILRQATASDPAQRYGTADALADDVQAFIERRPVRAQPRNAAYTTTRYVQRHPLGVTATVFALAVVIGASTLFAWRLRIERDAAEYQARVATSVLGFLQEDLLSAADPGAAPGHQFSVREALDVASATADARFVDAPVEHGAIRTTLATLYDQLGRYNEAEREARKAVALSVPSFARQEQNLAARSTLASVVLARDQLDEAETLIRSLISDADAGLGQNSREAFDARLLLARWQNRKGDFEQALASSSALVDATKTAFGTDDPLSLWASDETATNLQMLGRHDEALELLQASHATRLATRGAEHPATLFIAHEIGVLKRHQGRSEQALQWLQPNLDARRRVLGNAHPETLISANETATALQELKRYAEAEPLFSTTLDARERAFGEEHQFTRNSMSNLGLLYSLWGKLDQAAPLYERALAIESRLIGERHPDTLALMHNIAGLYRKQERLDDAVVMHQRVIEGAISPDGFGADAWQTGLFRAGFGSTWQKAKRYADAEREFQQALAILSASFGDDHERTQRVREMLEALQVEVAAAQ